MQNKLDPKTTAIIIIDLEKGYRSPTGDAAQSLGWDYSTMDEICKQHAPFLEELRRILPAENII